MTEHCDTCQNWNLIPRASSKPICPVLERELIGRFADYRWDMKIPALQPPANFGCIHHEARPEKKCGNCEHWGNECWTRSPGDMWFRCRARSLNNDTESLVTKITNFCDQWREKP